MQMKIPFFSIGKVISKGITDGLKFDIAGGILSEGDKFLKLSKMKCVTKYTNPEIMKCKFRLTIK